MKNGSFESAVNELNRRLNRKGVVRRRAWGALNMFVEFDGPDTLVFRGYTFGKDIDGRELKREILEEKDWYVASSIQEYTLSIRVMDFSKNSYKSNQKY